MENLTLIETLLLNAPGDVCFNMTELRQFGAIVDKLHVNGQKHPYLLLPNCGETDVGIRLLGGSSMFVYVNCTLKETPILIGKYNYESSSILYRSIKNQDMIFVGYERGTPTEAFKKVFEAKFNF